MFAKTIIDSDAFLDMPLSTQALYFHLAMRADDEGFVNNPKRIIRTINADEDSLRLLIAKQFVIPFESGIVVIRHWRVHNYIQSDRRKDTNYIAERAMLTQEKSGAYKLDTRCIQDVRKTDTQYSIGKYSIDKDSIVESICADAQTPALKTVKKFVPPTAEEVTAYCQETEKPIDVEAFINYYTSNGWKVGRNDMKDWKATVRQWRRRDEENGKVYQPKEKPSYDLQDYNEMTMAMYKDLEEKNGER